MTEMKFGRKEGAPLPPFETKSNINYTTIYSLKANELVEVRQWAAMRQGMISWHAEPALKRKYDELIIKIDEVLDKLLFTEESNGD